MWLVLQPIILIDLCLDLRLRKHYMERVTFRSWVRLTIRLMIWGKVMLSVIITLDIKHVVI